MSEFEPSPPAQYLIVCHQSNITGCVYSGVKETDMNWFNNLRKKTSLNKHFEGSCELLSLNLILMLQTENCVQTL